jgi:hypothetical protein
VTFPQAIGSSQDTASVIAIHFGGEHPHAADRS